MSASKKRSSRASATTKHRSIIVPLPESPQVCKTNLANNLVREGFRRAEARRMAKIAAS
jgi:molybdopterin biosynthesis enzyme MoaB